MNLKLYFKIEICCGLRCTSIKAYILNVRGVLLGLRLITASRP